MQVNLEVDKCIGSGSCELLAPEVFVVGEDGLAELLDATPGCGAAEKTVVKHGIGFTTLTRVVHVAYR